MDISALPSSVCKRRIKRKLRVEHKSEDWVKKGVWHAAKVLSLTQTADTALSGIRFNHLDIRALAALNLTCNMCHSDMKLWWFCVNCSLLSHPMILKKIIFTCIKANATLPMRKSSSWRTSTASLTLASGSARVSQARRIELGVISENFARKTCIFGFTKERVYTCRSGIYT